MDMTEQQRPEEPFAADDEDGMATTREQIKDVYFAGTSDGIIFLEGGQTKNVKQTDRVTDNI